MTYLGHHTKEVKKGIMLGFGLFIVSEVFVFFSVFWAFFHSAFVPSIEIGGQWPPLGITPLNSYSIPLLNTFLLLSSGAYITYSHHSLIAGFKNKTLIATLYTIFLALIFTLFQGFEYYTSSFSIADGIYGTTFFASTGLHGLTLAPIFNKNIFIKNNFNNLYSSFSINNNNLFIKFKQK